MRKAPNIEEHARESNDLLKRIKNQILSVFSIPILQKKKWIALPKLGEEQLNISDMDNFPIKQQETKDSCGLAAARMVVEDILKKRDITEKIQEKDVVKSLFLPKQKWMMEYIGITPGQMKSGIQELLNEHALPYKTEVKYMISYSEMQQRLREGSYIIFSYMGNSIDNPRRRMKDGKKNELLRKIHHPHYCILLKIDEKNQTATIANPFGFKEELPFDDFRDRISLNPKYLHSSRLYPFLVKSGIYQPRTCVIVRKNA